MGTSFFKQTKSACGSREDLTKLTRYWKIQGPSFGLKKNACGSREGLTLDSSQPAELLIWHFYIWQRHYLKVPTKFKTPNIKNDCKLNLENIFLVGK